MDEFFESFLGFFGDCFMASALAMCDFGIVGGLGVLAGEIFAPFIFTAIAAVLLGTKADLAFAVISLSWTILLWLVLISRLKVEDHLYDGINLVVSLITFIIGLFVPYHSVFSSYQYIGIFSGLALTFYPNVLFHIFRPLVAEYGFQKLSGILKGALGTVLALYIFFIPFAVVAIFIPNSWYDSIFSHVAYYNNQDVEEQRKNLGCAADDCVTQTLESYIDQDWQAAKDNYPQYFDGNGNLIESNREEFFSECLGTNLSFTDTGNSIKGSKYVGDNSRIVKLYDKQHNKYSYYKVNYQTKEITEVSKEDYES